MNIKQFWELLDCLEWQYEGDDEKVISPVVNQLSKMEDKDIFEFEEIMAELLYNIDGKQWAQDVYGDLSKCADDDFLYTRCVAIVNGEKYYNDVKNRSHNLNPDLEFESVLYIPQLAWEKKHRVKGENYTYVTRFSYETGSNAGNW